jgi:sugar fermentation stimulation protein A
VTYRHGDAALFPDAVSQRASRHARELSLVRGESVRSAMVFVVMRSDCQYVCPAVEIDPAYARTFESVCREGV